MIRRAVIALLAATVAAMAAGVAPAAAKQTWTVISGGGTRDFNVVANTFRPRTIEIGVGDTVRWQFRGFHTVTFLSGGRPLPLTVREGNNQYLNPQIAFPVGGSTYDGTGLRNSGTPPEDPAQVAKFKYSLTFTKPGTYDYYCAVHGPAQSGRVVVRAGASGSPAAALRAGERDLAKTVAAGRAAFARYTAERAGREVIVPLRGDPGAGYSIAQFPRTPVTVERGTTVTWVMRDPFEIHTVTFLGGQKLPPFLIPQPQPQGPPKLLVNPKVAAPAGGGTYDGTGYANSGILLPAGIPGVPAGRYSLTFVRPGTFAYLCVVHPWMVGRVIVK